MVFIVSLYEKPCKTLEWRITKGLSKGTLIIVEPHKVMPRCMAYSKVVRVECLDYDLTAFTATPCPAGHLRQGLECSFAGPEVRQMQGSICKQDTDQCYVRED